MVAPAADLRPFAVPPHRQRPTGLGQEGTDYREAARRPVAGQNGALGPVDPDQITTQCVDDGGGKGGHGRDARQHDTTGGADLCVRRGDAGGEGGVVGKVETVGAGGERGAGDRIAVPFGVLERTGRIHHQVGRQTFQRLARVTVPIHYGRRAAPVGAEGCRPVVLPAGDDDIVPRLDQQPRKAPAEHAVSAQNDDPHRQRAFLASRVERQRNPTSATKAGAGVDERTEPPRHQGAPTRGASGKGSPQRHGGTESPGGQAGADPTHRRCREGDIACGASCSRAEGAIPFLCASVVERNRNLSAPPGAVPAHICRSTIIFLISPIALAGLRPLGQLLAQFMMVWQR